MSGGRYEAGDVVLVHDPAAVTVFGYSPERWYRAVIIKVHENTAYASGIGYDIRYLPGEAINPPGGETVDASYVAGLVVTEMEPRRWENDMSHPAGKAMSIRRNYWPPATPRDLAKWLIAEDVRRGSSIHDIVMGAQGAGGCARQNGIGGWQVMVRGRKVIVWEWQDKQSWHVFGLEDLILEIKADARHDLVQAPLWEALA